MSFHLQILRLPSQHQHFELRSQRHTTWSSKQSQARNKQGSLSRFICNFIQEKFWNNVLLSTRRSFQKSTDEEIFSWEAVEGFYAIGRAEWFLMGGVHGWQTYSNVFWSNKQFGIWYMHPSICPKLFMETKWNLPLFAPSWGMCWEISGAIQFVGLVPLLSISPSSILDVFVFVTLKKEFSGLLPLYIHTYVQYTFIIIAPGSFEPA